MSNSERAARYASLKPYWLSGVATILAAVLMSGCTRSGFLGRQFDDLTARYNTYYNANRTFNEQEKKLEKRDPKIEMDRYLLVFEVPEVRGRSAEFEKVIEKSADLLRKHPQSKWVDNALMLIGKSYFYQTNYVGAEQKFTEVGTLDGPLFDEAA
ncbi:MAG: tol-pal system YbgF family protein, partial [Rhodothermia bacterium]